MSIKRFIADKDTTITNAFKADLQTRGVDANMGASDTLEVFSIYAQGVPPLDENGDFERDEEGLIVNTVEKARILVSFPISDIATARAEGNLPASGDVEFKLKLYNAVHGFTLPSSFVINIKPLSANWVEGIGLDMEEYLDQGASSGGKGADWNRASSSAAWATPGSDYIADGYTKTMAFETGTEDLEIDVTDVVEAWLAETIPNYGFVLMLSQSEEDCDSRESYYTKRFFARGTEHFFKKPSIEALWNSSKKDDRGKFYKKSNLRSVDDNTNIIYLKNLVSGEAKDIPLTGSLTLKVYADENKESEITPVPMTVTRQSAGNYKASLVVDTEEEYIYIDWQDDESVFHSEKIKVLTREVASETLPVYVTNITNMKSVYSSDETARFKLYCRLKDWNPTIYTVASKEVESSIIETAYFRIVRVVDEEVVIDYGEHTMLSYDKSGNYFDLDMELLETDYAYRIELQYDIEGNPQQQPETFKFRVE